MYNVQDIAYYLVVTAQNNSRPISNLKLQKLLYFLWKDYYKQTGKYLFQEPFVAWQFGPIEIDVYFEYYMYGAAPILLRRDSKDKINIEENDKRIADHVLEEYGRQTVFDLVNATHIPGGAWDRKFQNGSGCRSIIPFEYIKEDVSNGI